MKIYIFCPTLSIRRHIILCSWRNTWCLGSKIAYGLGWEEEEGGASLRKVLRSGELRRQRKRKTSIFGAGRGMLEGGMWGEKD